MARTLELCRDADVTFVGVGHIDATAPLSVDGVISAEESRALIAAGAVGEVVGWAIDGDGNLIQGLTNDRVTSAPLRVANPNPVIGIAVGEAKVKAILAALRGRLINGLVTDEATARSLLSLV